MAQHFFQNNVSQTQDLWYNSHKKIIQYVAAELNAPDKTEELVEKFLGKQIKIKKTRDAAMPKRPKSSFLFFCDEKRQDIMKNNDNMKIGDIMKKLGKAWKNQTNKTKYIQLASVAKINYEEKIEEYNLNNFYN